MTRLAVPLLALALLGAGASLQPEPGGEPEQALRCWRRVGANAVRVGERFGMTLTCRVVETEQARAVPDLSGLQPETLDAPPFDVVGGERFDDVRGGSGRLLQYHYTLRLIGEDHFGRDVELPPLTLDYRIERRADGGEMLPGRELTYVLPAERIRVLSLVPAGRADIRGVSPGTLGAAAARRFRAELLGLAAAGLGLLALGALALGVRRARQARRGAAERAVRPVPAAAVARAVLRELAALQKGSLAGGWTPDSVQRALAALRLAAALALQQAVAERADGGEGEPLAGELRVRSGLLRARTVLVSSALTPAALAGEPARLGGGPADGLRLGGGPAGEPARRSGPAGEPTRRSSGPADGSRRSAELDRLRSTLAAFTAARYARDGAPESGLLTRELDAALAAIRPLRLRTLAPVRRLAGLAASVRSGWRGAWTR